MLRCCGMLSAVCYWSSIWDQMDMWCVEVELYQRLVSEVELGSGHMVVVFCSVLWYLRWTMVWDVDILADFDVWNESFVEIHQILVSEVDLLFFVDIGWDPSEVCCWGGSCWCRRRNLLLLIRFQQEVVCEAWSLWWVMASMMNYLIKNISKLFIVLYDHKAIYSKSAWPTLSKADTETDCSWQKLHMFRHGFPLPSLSTGWPGFGGKRIGFAF